MVVESNSVLVLYDGTTHIKEILSLESLSNTDFILSIADVVASPEKLEGEFSLVIADLAFSEPDSQKTLLEILSKIHIRNASLVVLHEKDDMTGLLPEILEKTDVLLTHPVSDIQLKSVMDEGWNSYSQKTAMQKDLNAIMGAFKTMDRGRFPFQNLSEAKSLSMLLSIMCPNSNDAAVGLLELMVNGIEHGNLGITFEEKGQLLEEGKWHTEVENRLSDPAYSDRFVTIEFERTKEKIEFLISDEGNGFDVEKYASQKTDDDGATDFTLFHGRGIKLARKICFDALEYLGHGNQVRATIQL